MPIRTRAVVALAASLAMTPVAKAESVIEALAFAYANNAAIASAVLSVKMAAEDIAIRSAGQRPQINASGNVTYQWGAAEGAFAHSASGSVAISYSQNLFDNLRTDAQIDQAQAMAEAAKQGLRNSEQNVLLSAASAYFAVVRDTQLASSRSENVAFLQAQVDSARERFNIGEGTNIDVAQAEARLAGAVAAYRSAVSQLQSSQASFARWVGHQSNSLSATFPYDRLLPASLDEALVMADRNHPAIRAAAAQAEAARYATDAALRAFGPTLDLVGSISSAFTTSPMSPSPSLSGSVGLRLAIPIYAGGALGAGARVASLAQSQSMLEAQLTRDQVRESVIAAWSGLQTAIAQIESADSAVAASELALNGVIEQRNVGQLTTLDVLNARAELTGAREAAITARASRYIAAFSLLAATGRLSAADLGLPVQIRSADAYQAAVSDAWGEIRDVDAIN